MGDIPPGSRTQTVDDPAHELVHGLQPSLASTPPHGSPENPSTFYSQINALPQGRPRLDFRLNHQMPPQYPGREHGNSAFYMNSMMNTLPKYVSSEDTTTSMTSAPMPHNFLGASPSAVTYPLGQNLQVPTQSAVIMPTHLPYISGPPASFQQPFIPQHNTHHGSYNAFDGISPRLAGQVPYQSYENSQQYMYYTSSYIPHGHYNPGLGTQPAQAVYARKAELPNTAPNLRIPGGGFHHGFGALVDNHMNKESFQGISRSMVPGQGTSYMQSLETSRFGSMGCVPRGPPRKPKQSGHALWVGNLPPGTTVLALKDHFSREATQDIESLFLIAKSNCAFVNYKSETSCMAAMHRFHDSRFCGVRLVCRLRRSSTPTSGVPTGPSAMTGSQQKNNSRPATPEQDGTILGREINAEQSPCEGKEDSRPSAGAKKKFFIVKSLTLQDLELSVRNGMWSTQSHNEEILNKAFRSTENVYLIFSANKSGEYFGYARMSSEILTDKSHPVDPVPGIENTVDGSDVPKSIPTLATEWAPKGRIIDDSARGTIFWEAEPIDVEDDGKKEGNHEGNIKVESEAPIVAQSWGNPFKIAWISTNRLPFYRTRGLRNPWNANREVKIARDGTELEPGVGERLIQMFHRLGPSTTNPPMRSSLSGPQVAVS